jgi:hypothetical protein
VNLPEYPPLKVMALPIVQESPAARAAVPVQAEKLPDSNPSEKLFKAQTGRMVMNEAVRLIDNIAIIIMALERATLDTRISVLPLLPSLQVSADALDPAFRQIGI